MQEDEHFQMEVEHHNFQPQNTAYEHMDILLIDGHHYNQHQESINDLIQLHHVKVILLVNHQADVDSVQAIQLGVYGILLNHELEGVHLVEMIHSIQQGEKFMSRSLTPAILQDYYVLIQEKPNTARQDIQPLPHSLTKREIETLEFLVEGMANTEIASAMRISEKTVKNHIANMFQKVHVNNRNKLVAIAIRNNWISMM
ncbi:MAG TPA: response regulator transcription factor [Sphingobacterium sp.]|nr:response regulator transcription factor [Sphingobacterium sp.]